MTKALVTGATGFIGKVLVPYLLERGVSVRVLVRNFSPSSFPVEVEQHIGDLTNPNSLVNAASNVDVVFHLGGYAHAWQNNEDEKHKQINLNGTENILEECIRAKVKKFIFFSSVKAVGDSEDCIDETWEGLPNTPYGKAKREAEYLVLAKGLQYNIHVCILRLALVYGPELKGNLYQMLRAIDKGYFLAIPKVQNHRSLISVPDVCQAAWLAAQHDVANGKIYFVTDKISYSTYRLYELILTGLGRSMPRWRIPLWIFKYLAWMGDQGERFLRRRLPFNSEAFQKLFGSSQYSSLRIQLELGFCPKYSLAKMLPEIIRIYREGE